MDPSAATVWWVLAGIAVATELATGTFYLLMFALGLVGAALAAHLGTPVWAQVLTAAVVGGGATAAWHAWRRSRGHATADVATNRDVNLDIGERVNVPAWAGDRTARVPYRGSTWTARLEPGALAVPGEHVVRAVEGNWLVLAPVPR